MAEEVTVEMLKNGPLWIEPRGAFNLIDHDGTPIPLPKGKNGVAFCRCGHSSNKPFCDGTHSKVGFDGTCNKAVAEHVDE